MTISNAHPMYEAQLIAQYIDNDPIMCRQIREHLSEERLLDLFEIKPETHIVEEDPYEMPELIDVLCNHTPSEVLKALLDRFNETELAEMAENLKQPK